MTKGTDSTGDDDRRSDDRSASGLAVLDRVLSRNGILVALAVAWVATLGSLYFSEVRLFIPCRLCWFQRIFMYPLAVILPIGILRRDRAIAWYVIPLALIGGSISVYHILLQKTRWFTESAACEVTVPCSGQYINWLGFISIPVLALTAFVLIILTTSAMPSDGDDRSGEGVQNNGAAAPWRPVLGLALIIGLAFAFLWWRG